MTGYENKQILDTEPTQVRQTPLTAGLRKLENVPNEDPNEDSIRSH